MVHNSRSGHGGWYGGTVNCGTTSTTRNKAHPLDHPTTLGIGGIGCAIASEGVHKVKPCSWRLLVGAAPGCCVGDDA